MGITATNLAWIPALPLAAAGILALLPRRAARPAMALAIAAMSLAFVLSVAAFVATLGGHGGAGSGTVVGVANFDWFPLAGGFVRLGFLLDPLGALMLVMVSFVGLLIFIFSVGYMAEDPHRVRFFGYLSLFAAAMLGLVMANSLLLLFACWEVMGLASYLLIGFWYERPAAAAAAKKAFLVTRVGDLGLFAGLLWLYQESGTLLFHDGGAGCLEPAVLAGLHAAPGFLGLTVAGSISLLLFAGAVGKSGQVPLHVWLPDAMEGPTPVSALIHAATMVAAGVFLMARVFPLVAGPLGGEAGVVSPVLQVVTWVGAITAVFAALVALGQDDIKRVLAYSTVSQLGYMFVGLGTGGVAVAMFHLITHAFFKALLFLGAGSVIHGCHGEQDIRRMGGLRRWMPVTFATYAVGMMALSGVPLLFSGFWSKDEILHAAWLWQPSCWPFVLALGGAFLTAFYMTRQTAEVFAGAYRGGGTSRHGGWVAPHESPRSMTLPLVLLAVATLGLGWLGTPAWPWFEAYLSGHAAVWSPGRLSEAIPMMLASTAVVVVGVGLGWGFYGRRPRVAVETPDPVEARFPGAVRWLRGRFFVDEFYAATLVRAHGVWAQLADWLDRLVIGGLVMGSGWAVRGAALLLRWMDEWVVNAGFDGGCRGLDMGGGWLSRIQNGQAQRYLALAGAGVIALVLLVVWGVRGG